MANPQKENGYTAIANEIMEFLCHYRIPGEERQIFDTIVRKTYGFNKCEDIISLSQFVEATGIKKPNVVGAINSLLSKKIIVVIQKDNEAAKVYKINKNYEQWKSLSKKITLSKRITSVIQTDNASLSKRIPTKDNTTKDTIQKTINKVHGNGFDPPEWLPMDEWVAYVEMRNKIKKPLTVKAKSLAVKKLLQLKSDGHLPEDVLNQSIFNSWQGLFPIRNTSTEKQSSADDKFKFLDNLK